MRSSIKGIAPQWYTLSIDVDEAEPVQFYLKPLTSFDWLDIMAVSKSKDSHIEMGFAGIKLAFKLGVKGWKNIEDGDNPGEPLQFSRAAMDTLEKGWILEVGHQVLEMAELDEDAVKKSDSPS